MAGIVSLPMYDWPEVRGDIDAFYGGLREHLRQQAFDPPESLVRSPDPLQDWRSADLLVSQTCGLPYVRVLRGSVSLLGTPTFDLPGCTNGRYASALVVRADSPARDVADLEGARAIVNGMDSQSGCAALFQVLIAAGHTAPYFAETRVSGSHRASADAVARADADVCALDPVSWQLLQDWDPEVARRLRVLSWGQSVPALPLVTAHDGNAGRLAALQKAVAAAFDDPALAPVRRALYLSGLVSLDDSDYDSVASGWRAVQASGFIDQPR